MEWIDGVKLTDTQAMHEAGLSVVDFVDVGGCRCPESRTADQQAQRDSGLVQERLCRGNRTMSKEGADARS